MSCPFMPALTIPDLPSRSRILLMLKASRYLHDVAQSKRVESSSELSSVKERNVIRGPW